MDVTDKQRIEELTKQNLELLQRVEMLSKPFDFENAVVIELEVDDAENNVPEAKVVKLNQYEFVNGHMYHSLISRHFREITDGMAMMTIGNRMATAIEEAVAENKASKNLIDSLDDWNKIVLNK
jgi:hypothetical protein